MRKLRVVKGADVLSIARGGPEYADVKAAGVEPQAKAEMRSAADDLRLDAFRVLFGQAEPQAEFAVEEHGGEIRYVAPVATDVVVAVTGTSVRLERSHASFFASGDTLDQLKDAVGSEIRFAADPGDGEILSVLGTAARTPLVRVGKRPLYDSLKELQKARPEPKPAFPTFDRIRAVHKVLTKQPHIPFVYPKNGCWVRAEGMAQILVRHLGISGRLLSKVWIRCKNDALCLQVKTNVNPKCKVTWWWHVAPLIEGKFAYWVIDPSLSDEPLRLTDWRAKMNTTKTVAPFRFSTWERYGLTDDWDIDADEKKAYLKNELAEFRNLLSAQIFNDGPIPYTNCPL